MRIAVVFLAFCSTTTLAQTTPPPSSPPEALRILNEVSQKYADAQAYHIEAVEEQISSNDLRRDWRKTIMSLSVAPGGRYRYEGRTGFGSGLTVSDGKTVWTYHYDEQLYTQKAAETDSGTGHRLMEHEEQGVEQAKHLRLHLAQLANRLISAELLPEETIMVGGAPRRCTVVHYTPANLKEGSPQAKAKEEGTIWIDKEQKVIVKLWHRDDSYIVLPGSRAHVPFLDESTTVFPVVELDARIPDSTFVFTPPAEAKLVDEFPAQKQFAMHQAKETEAANELLGKPAPDVELKSADGKAVHLSFFRGKPVLIDVWATWCGPCVAMLPELKKLNEELSATGIVFFTVDIDEDASAATTFLAREKASWQNYHDNLNAMSTAFHWSQGIPWQVLLDSAGKVAFMGSEDKIPELRAALAKLGPQYTSLAPPASPQ